MRCSWPVALGRKLMHPCRGKDSVRAWQCIPTGQYLCLWMRLCVYMLIAAIYAMFVRQSRLSEWNYWDCGASKPHSEMQSVSLIQCNTFFFPSWLVPEKTFTFYKMHKQVRQSRSALLQQTCIVMVGSDSHQCHVASETPIGSSESADQQGAWNSIIVCCLILAGFYFEVFLCSYKL